VNSGKWIKLEDAYYAYHKEFWTPMAYGVVSFAKKEDAEKFVAEQGKGEVFDFNQLLNHKWGFE
jgi:copper chaperone NosL